MQQINKNTTQECYSVSIAVKIACASFLRLTSDYIKY